MSGNLTAEERELLKDPKVSRGAQIEAEFRNRGRTHDQIEFADVVDALIDAHPDWTTVQTIESLVAIYVPSKKPWWRWW